MKVIKEGKLRELEVVCGNCKSELLITKKDLLEIERVHLINFSIVLSERYIKCPVCREVGVASQDIIDYLEGGKNA